jgi:hypothetical protein
MFNGAAPVIELTKKEKLSVLQFLWSEGMCETCWKLWKNNS